jgi:uncharacterized protein YndB with AHSA1/START domain
MNTSQRSKAAIDHATFTITFRRTFTAPREQVFDAWTKPDQIAEWWDPSGARLSECTIDLRPGGAFKFVNRDSAHSPPFAGVYRSIERPAKLVFEALGATGTVSLEERDDLTFMTVSIRCSSADHLKQFIQVGVDVGTDQTLDNLVKYLH